MPVHLVRRVRSSVACLLTAFILLAAAPASAAPVPSAMPLSARPTAASALTASAELRALSAGGPFAAAEPQIRDLPTGSYVSGRMGVEGGAWMFMAHRGQDIRFLVNASAASGFAMGLFDYGMLVQGAGPESLITVTEPGSSGGFDYTSPYDAVYMLVLLPESPGAYRLTWDISDPVPYLARRIAGSSRTETALQLSRDWAEATAAIVCTGRGFADALAASSLAGSYDCPILLTEPGALSAGVDARITELGVNTVFVIGSTAAVSQAVYDALDHDGRTMQRIEGVNRYLTAARIADQVKVHELESGRTPATEAFIVNGMGYPDALSISSYAFTTKMPVLLVQPWAAPPGTTQELTTLGIQKAYVIGGRPAVSDAVMNNLPVLAKQRVYGADRVGTSLAAAALAVNKGWGLHNYVSLCTGWNYPDALAGGPWTGNLNGITILTQPMSMTTSVYEEIRTHRSSEEVAVFGSTAAVGGCVLGFADHALQGDTLPLPYHGE